MARRQLQRVALYARRHYRIVFVGTLVVVALSFAAASRLQFDTDVLNLLPRDSTQVRTLRRALEEFGSVDLLVVVIRIPEDARLDAYESFTTRLGKRLENVDLLTKVDYKFGNLDEILPALLPQALLFLDQEGRESVERKLGSEAVRQRVRELRRLIATPQALAAKRLIQLDPMGLAEVFLDQVEGSKEGLAIDWTSGYLLSRDHRMMLILAKPEEAPQNVDFARQLIEAVQGEVQAAQIEWNENDLDIETDPPAVDLAGRYVFALEDDGVIRRDAYISIATSMVGVLVLFLWAFRRVGLVAYAFVPLSCGLILAFGFAGALYGTLSPATSGVAGLLIGLGIDFVIVSYGRYVEERKAGADLEAALKTMSGSCGRAVLVGGITSAATFYSFGVTDFVGLLQMGLLTGTGILFCMAAVIVLLPAMLAWSEDRQKKRSRVTKLYLHGLGSANLVRASIRWPKPVLAAGIAITIIAAYLSLGLEFKDSVQAMRPEGQASAVVRDEVAERFGLGFEQMLFLIRGETLSEVLALSEKAASGAKDLVDRGVLTGFDTVTTMIPPMERQQANLEWLSVHRDSWLDTEGVLSVFTSEAAKEGLRLDPFAEGLDLLTQSLRRDRPIEPLDFQGSRQTRVLLDRFLQQTEDGWEAVIYLTPPAKIWRREAPPEVVQLANELGPAVELTGANVVSQFLRDRVLRDAVIAAVLGLVLVALILWLDFRSLSVTMMSLAPLTMGIVWMLGGMAAIGDSMNFMNVFVTTMIIGIGVDYGIHMIHRDRELLGESDEAFMSGLSETGKAIVLAALSTVVGFGSLSLSHYPGLQSMGKVAILGALSTALVAVTVLPAYLTLSRRAGRSQSAK
jgi:predicted RND superfamily exporter protein